MRKASVRIFLFLMALSTLSALGQQPATPSTTAIPNLINFSGTLADLSGKPLTSVQGVTFLLYSAQQGGNPLWMETQNITPVRNGQYTATLGVTTAQGLPADIFSSGEARWLAVQVVGQSEQPRVLLVAVPYAIKAADAQTIGGLPPSAFVLAAPSSAVATSAANTPESSAPFATPNGAITGAGTVGYLPLWDKTSDIVSSALFQTGSGTTAKIGLNNPTPAATLDVGGNSILRGSVSLPNAGTATTTAGKNSQPFGQAASAFNTTSGKAVTQTFEWLAEPVNNDTATASATLNLLFGQGTTKPTETGLHVASNGLINFAAGQTFPGTGTGTITGVTAGTDLKGGGASGTVTLNLDTTKVPQLTANNTFTGTQTINNTVSITGASASAQFTATNTDHYPAVVGTSAGNGVEGISTGVGGVAVYGTSSGPRGFGVEGDGDYGVAGFSSGCSDMCAGGEFSGYIADASNAGGPGVVAIGGNGADGGYGVLGYGGDGGFTDGDAGYFIGGSGSSFGDAINANAGTGYAGNFGGNVVATGSFTGGLVESKIDHPLDPANKYLAHASIGSSEMMNLYTGNVTTDAQGLATVRLPGWFEMLNTDFRYQLTVIGQFAQAIIGQKIENHQFQIRSSVPNVEVSWQVTGIRQDAYAKAHPLVVEEGKDQRLQGFYLHPALYGAPPEKQLEWARHPQQMKRTQRHRQAPQSSSASTQRQFIPPPSDK